MSTKRIKARRMWICAEANGEPVQSIAKKHGWPYDDPVFVIPADAKSVSELADQVAATIYEHAWGDMAKARETATSILSGFGLLSGKAGKGRK